MFSPDGRTILLIDPFKDEREMYDLYLRSCGFKTFGSADPKDALRWGQDRSADAAVVRLRQSGPTDGIEVIRQIKTLSRMRRTPVLVLSTSIDPAHRTAAGRAGCDAYLLIPLPPDMLVAEIAQLLERGHGTDG